MSYEVATPTPTPANAPAGYVCLTVLVHQDDVGEAYRRIGELWTARTSSGQKRGRRPRRRHAVSNVKQAETLTKGARMTNNPTTRTALLMRAEDLLTEASGAPATHAEFEKAVQDAAEELHSAAVVKRHRRALVPHDARQIHLPSTRPKVLVKGDRAISVSASTPALPPDHLEVVADRMDCKMIVYAPPGAGKTTLKERWARDRPKLKVHDTDDGLDCQADIVFTNLHSLIGLKPTLAVRYDEQDWNARVRSKCPDWRPEWFASSLQRRGDRELHAVAHLAAYERQIYTAYLELPWHQAAHSDRQKPGVAARKASRQSA